MSIIPDFVAKLMALTAMLAIATVAGAALAQTIAHPQDAAAIFEQAVAAGDIDAIAALYAPRAALLTPDGRDAHGRDAIRGVYATNQRLGANSMQFHDVTAEEGPDSAMMYWGWTLTITPSGKDQIKVNGRSALFWKRIDGRWQIVLDMFQVLPRVE
jgi:uncharacterized protein (TIGR02246 family)